MFQRIILRSVLIALLAALTAATSVSASGKPAKIAANPNPSASCDELPVYRTAMLKAGKRWIKGMERDGLAGRSTRGFSEADWNDYAARANRLLADLRAIDPPVFATPWHEAMIDSARLKVNFARSASLVGFDFTADFLAKRVTATSTELTDAREAAISTCSDFDAFYQEWDRLDGKSSTADSAS
ncbi:MAG TPA: hypothetical protein VH482_00285 [Thermomicrobiales bacterium]|jgi:hypothetical protein